jgi:hypothetical protein
MASLYTSKPSLSRARISMNESIPATAVCTTKQQRQRQRRVSAQPEANPLMHYVSVYATTACESVDTWARGGERRGVSYGCADAASAHSLAGDCRSVDDSHKGAPLRLRLARRDGDGEVAGAGRSVVDLIPSGVGVVGDGGGDGLLLRQATRGL